MGNLIASWSPYHVRPAWLTFSLIFGRARPVGTEFARSLGDKYGATRARRVVSGPVRPYAPPEDGHLYLPWQATADKDVSVD